MKHQQKIWHLAVIILLSTSCDMSTSTLIDEGLDYIDIYTREELEAVADDLAGAYRLITDIDLSSGDDFVPIGTPSDPFTGIFEGNNKSIKGLTINESEESYQGLFSIIEGKNQSSPARVQNLIIENASITGHGYLGALAGIIALHSEITAVEARNVYIDAQYIYAGGIVGHLEGGVISKSFSSGEVSSEDHGLGGIAGKVSDGGQISESYSSADLRSDATNGSEVGGLVGTIVGRGPTQKSSIINSYAIGNVSATSQRAGGLVGFLGDYGSILHCYSSAESVSASTSTGAFIGEAANSSSITQSYYSTISGLDGIGTTGSGTVIATLYGYSSVSGEIFSAPGTAIEEDNFLDWDFEDTWKMTRGQWPILQW